MITRQALWWHLRSLPARLGRVGMLGLLLSLGALVAQQHLVSPLQQLRAEEARALELQEGQLRTEVMSLARKREQERDRQVPAAIEGQDDLTNTLGTVLSLGQECGLTLDAGEYRLGAVPAQTSSRLTMNFSTRGNYGAVRCLVKELAGVRGLRVDALKLSRTDASLSELSVQLQLSLPLQIAAP